MSMKGPVIQQIS